MNDTAVSGFGSMPQRWEHVDGASGLRHRVRPAARDVQVIDDERQRRLFEQLQHPRRVDWIDRIGQSNVGEPGIGEHFGLAEFGAADADGAAVDLPARHHRALVGLRMRPHADAALIGRLLHAIDIGQRTRLVDEYRGRLKIQ
jgi:hypothetical protein